MSTLRYITLLLFAIPAITYAQTIDLLIKNGHVFDPKNNRDAIMDVAIAGGKNSSRGQGDTRLFRLT